MKHWYENDFVTGLAPVSQQAVGFDFVGYPEHDWEFLVGVWASGFWLEGQLYKWMDSAYHVSSLPYFMKSLIIWNSEWYGEGILPTAQDLGASDGY